MVILVDVFAFALGVVPEVVPVFLGCFADVFFFEVAFDCLLFVFKDAKFFSNAELVRDVFFVI
tara:strand:- start:19354 stop:19542 length:189 start_codon:yes stop_codon:yes gene_type:complete